MKGKSRIAILLLGGLALTWSSCAKEQKKSVEVLPSERVDFVLQNIPPKPGPKPKEGFRPKEDPSACACLMEIKNPLENDQYSPKEEILERDPDDYSITDRYMILSQVYVANAYYPDKIPTVKSIVLNILKSNELKERVMGRLQKTASGFSAKLKGYTVFQYNFPIRAIVSGKQREWFQGPIQLEYELTDTKDRVLKKTVTIQEKTGVGAEHTALFDTKWIKPESHGMATYLWQPFTVEFGVRPWKGKSLNLEGCKLSLLKDGVVKEVHLYSSRKEDKKRGGLREKWYQHSSDYGEKYIWEIHPAEDRQRKPWFTGQITLRVDLRARDGRTFQSENVITNSNAWPDDAGDTRIEPHKPRYKQGYDWTKPMEFMFFAVDRYDENNAEARVSYAAIALKKDGRIIAKTEFPYGFGSGSGDGISRASRKKNWGVFSWEIQPFEYSNPSTIVRKAGFDGEILFVATVYDAAGRKSVFELPLTDDRPGETEAKGGSSKPSFTVDIINPTPSYSYQYAESIPIRIRVTNAYSATEPPDIKICELKVKGMLSSNVLAKTIRRDDTEGQILQDNYREFHWEIGHHATRPEWCYGDLKGTITLTDANDVKQDVEFVLYDAEPMRGVSNQTPLIRAEILEPSPRQILRTGRGNLSLRLKVTSVGAENLLRDGDSWVQLFDAGANSYSLLNLQKCSSGSVTQEGPSEWSLEYSKSLEVREGRMMLFIDLRDKNFGHLTLFHRLEGR